VIGEVSLIWRSVTDGQGEVGYIFHPDAQHHGYATEAARALLHFGFGQVGLHRIYARCDARNEPSWRLMERLGMRREAHFRQHIRVKGRWDEELIYAVLASEWQLPR
jgi:RimJ/RimL family protein N-acetyltransferase